jgi:hypothetical protein
MKAFSLLFSLLLAIQRPYVGAETSQRLRGSEEPAHKSTTQQVSPQANDNAAGSLTKVHPELANRILALHQDESLHVIIGFRNAAGRDKIIASKQQNSSLYREFSTIAAVATTISVGSLNDYDLDDNIAFIEPDLIVTSASQAIPSSILKMQGPPGYYVEAATITAPTSGSCSDPNSFKIGIVDSGVGKFHQCFEIMILNSIIVQVPKQYMLTL